MDREAFNEAFLRKLKLLEIVARKALKGRGLGKHPGSTKGGEVTFKDYHEYTPGEEYRYIDWNIYGRLERLFVKEFAREEEIPVAILVDMSRSMEYGTPTKGTAARQLAAALSYTALAGKNRLSIGLANHEGLSMMGPITGERAFFEVLEFLSSTTPSGSVEIFPLLRTFHERTREPSLLIFISDLLEEGEGMPALSFLNAKGYDLCLLQVLCREELHPSFRGPIRLVDLESEESRALVLSEEQLDEYAQGLRRFLQGWEEYALRHGIRHLLCRSDDSLENLLMNFLRKGGFVS